MANEVNAIILIVALATTGLFAQTTTRHVPAAYATIQSAVNAAANGDTVQIAAGTYFESVVVTGKSIFIRGATTGQTVIDGLSAQRCLELAPGASIGTMVVHISDLRLTYGLAAPSSGRIEGGGLLVRSGILEVSLINCEIDHCLAVQGCGIQVDPGPRFYIQDSSLHHNGWWPLPGGPSSPVGGAVRVTTDFHATNCEFADNSMPHPATTGFFGRGGAIAFATPASGTQPLISIKACRFLRNTADQGGAIFGDADSYISSYRSRYEDNWAAFSGGAVQQEFGTYARFDRDLFAGHDGLWDYKVFDLKCDRISLSRCTIADNAPSNVTAKVMLLNMAPSPSTGIDYLSIRDTIIAGNGNDVSRYAINATGNLEGLSVIYGAPPEYVDRNTFLPIPPPAALTAYVGYSDDPGFVDASLRDLHLRPGSLAIDRGTVTSSTLPSQAGMDIDGNPAIIGPRWDIGCYELQNRDPGPAWAGSVPDGTGGSFDSLTVNGSAGGTTRSLLLPVSSSFTIALAPAPGETSSNFVLYGYFGLPRLQDALPIPFAQGTIVFLPQVLVPYSPEHIILADSTGSYPALIWAPPAPWSVSGLTSPVPARLTLQAFQTVGPADIRLSNAIVIDAQ